VPGPSRAARRARPGTSTGRPRLRSAAEGTPHHPSASRHRGVSPGIPVRLRFLQELHLVLHAGARLQLLHHHLRAADARVHLAQEHLRRGTGSSASVRVPQSPPCPALALWPASPGSPPLAPTLPNQPCPISFR